MRARVPGFPAAYSTAADCSSACRAVDAGAESAAMRASIGPPGPDLDFETWTLALVGYLRGLLPGVAAARKRGAVILGYERRRATIR
jgi:hypothetical protein